MEDEVVSVFILRINLIVIRCLGFYDSVSTIRCGAYGCAVFTAVHRGKMREFNLSVCISCICLRTFIRYHHHAVLINRQFIQPEFRACEVLARVIFIIFREED